MPKREYRVGGKKIKMKNNNEFKVSFKGLNLTNTQAQKIDAAIQKAALGELAVLGISGKYGISAFDNRLWRGKEVIFHSLKNMNPGVKERANEKGIR